MSLCDAVVTLRAYEELSDHLPPARRKRDFEVDVPAGSSVNDLLGAVGIPPGEVDLVLVDGEPADLGRALAGAERVAVYPVFEAFDVGGMTPRAAGPLREPKFVADEHLARLARYLRLAGFDTWLAPGLEDHALVEAAESDARILLTRDRHLVEFLRPSRVVVPCADRPAGQFVEIIRRLQLESAARPFSRCMVCNAPLGEAALAEVAGRVPDRVLQGQETFLACSGCGRIYWPGSHHRRMRGLLAAAGIRTG